MAERTARREPHTMIRKSQARIERAKRLIGQSWRRMASTEAHRRNSRVRVRERSADRRASDH